MRRLAWRCSLRIIPWGLLGLYDSCWKYILETDSGRAKLFNVCQDPGELHDVSGERVERERAYRSKVQGWIAAQKGNE